MTEPSAIIVKNLERSASDRVVGLLDLVANIASGGVSDCYWPLGRLHCCSCLWVHLCPFRLGFPLKTPRLPVGLPRTVASCSFCGMYVLRHRNRRPWRARRKV